jgi:predicted transcriptional regulator
MDIQLEKLELIKLLKETDSPFVINAIKKIFRNEKEYSNKELDDYAIEGIEKGLDDVKNGRVVPYEEVKKKFGWI